MSKKKLKVRASKFSPFFVHEIITKVGFQKFFCTAKEFLDPPRKLRLLVSTDTRVPPLEAFFEIVAFGVKDILGVSKPPPKLLHDFIFFL